jgi:hypothetical protein
MGGSADPWRRERARVAAGSVFSLAHEDPVLRPGATETIERVATMLPLRDGPIPRRAVEEVVAAMAAGEVARLVFRAEERAPQRWRALVDEVGGELAQEPLLAGIATAAIEELLPPPLWLVVMREATADAAPGPIDVLATLPRTTDGLVVVGGRSCVGRLPATFTSGRADRSSMFRAIKDHDMAPRPSTIRGLSGQSTAAGRRGSSYDEPASRGFGPHSRTEGASELCERLLLGAVARLEGLVPIAPSAN